MTGLPNYPQAVGVSVINDTLTVDLADGRTISVPLAWYPRLLQETPQGRRNWRLTADGRTIEWPGLALYILVEDLLRGEQAGMTYRFSRFPMPYVTESLECKVDEETGTYEETPDHEVGIAMNRMNCMQAGQELRPIARVGAKITYGSKVVPLDFVKGSNPDDEYFIAALPEKKFEVFLNNNPQVKTAIMDNGNLKKIVCYASYYSEQDHRDGWPTDLKMAFFVSDSPNHTPEGEPFVHKGGKRAPINKNGVLNIEDYVLVPCKVKEYNAKVLNPCKALGRWYKRNRLEPYGGASLRQQLSLMEIRRCEAKESREFPDFTALDLGGGPLANTWIVAVAERLSPGWSMHVLDIDNRALLAGASVYGEDLASVGFDWEERAKQGSAYETPYDDGMFDFIMAINSIENIVNSVWTGAEVEEHRDDHLTEDHRRKEAGRRFFRELDRILKPRGRLYLSTWAGGKKSHTYPYCFTKAELVSFAKGTRLRIVAISKPWTWKHDDGTNSKMLSAVFEKH